MYRNSRLPSRTRGLWLAKEVVQVYGTDVVSSVVTPVKSLVGFEKVDCSKRFGFGGYVISSFDHSACASTTVSITVPAAEFALWPLDQEMIVELGLFMVTTGTGDQVYANSTFIVTA
jgi:Fibronectin type III-like domain